MKEEKMADKVSRLIDDHYRSGDVETAKTLIFLRNMLIIKERELSVVRLTAHPYIDDRYQDRFKGACKHLRRLTESVDKALECVKNKDMASLAEYHGALMNRNMGAYKFLEKWRQLWEDVQSNDLPKAVAAADNDGQHPER